MPRIYVFYAGAPIVVNGAAIGTLCIIDDLARDTFDAEDREALSAFARIIEDELSLRENLRRTAEKFEDKYRDAENLAQAGEIAKAQFLALMSHELRTPLNAVIGFAECISNELMGPIGSEQYKEFARNIALSGRRQLSLVERLLTLSNTGTIDVEEQTIELNALVSRCVDVLAGESLIAGISVDTELPPGPVSITGDPLHIEQIVLELIGNAIKFTPKDGRVKIRLLLDANGSAVFEVIDSGQGIDNSTLDEALAIFGRISVDDSKTYDGAGLGLPLVKKLADLHGANLTLTARPGGGTRAQICFPPYRTTLAHSA
jgi:signal transduction histidine kinase